jgi:hypothetical protein
VKRRVLFGVLVVAILLGARFLFVRPVDVTLELQYGSAAAKVRKVALVFTGSDEHVARDLDLSYPTGAPQSDRRSLRIKPGDYTVGARLELDGEPARILSRPLHVGEPGVYPLELDH